MYGVSTGWCYARKEDRILKMAFMHYDDRRSDGWQIIVWTSCVISEESEYQG